MYNYRYVLLLLAERPITILYIYLLTKYSSIEKKKNIDCSTLTVILIYSLCINRIDRKIIRKTCPWKVYLIKPPQKLGFAGVYLIFLFSIQNIQYECTLEPPRRGGSNVHPQCMSWVKMYKNKIKYFPIRNFQVFFFFFHLKISVYCMDKFS